MTLQQFHETFDALDHTQHLACARCGVLARDGCHHLVEDFAPTPSTGTGRTLPRVTSVRINAVTGLPLPNQRTPLP